MTSDVSGDDVFNKLSPKHLSEFKGYVFKLYNFQLENAKEIYNQLLIDIELDIGKESIIVEKLTKKMLFDLKSYLPPEDAAWFIKRRLERVGQEHFGTLSICDCLSKYDEDFKEVHTSLLEIAKKGDNTIKLLLANVLMAVHLTKDKDNLHQAEDMVPEINMLLDRVDTESSVTQRTEYDDHYLCWAYCDLAFLYRNLNVEKKRVSFFRVSLELNEAIGKDLGLSIYLETFLVRALAKQRPYQEEVVARCEHLLDNVRRALEYKAYFSTVYGVKILREAFIEASRIYNVKKVRNETVIEVGKLVYESLEEQFGETHQEVVVTASQMAYQFQTFKETVLAERFFRLASNGFEKMGEGSKVLLDIKARVATNLCKVMTRRKKLQEAERYCREEIRLKVKEHGESNQYVSQMYRSLGFIVSKQGRKQEAVGYMEHALQISKECCPTFVNYHEMLENEMRRNK